MNCGVATGCVSGGIELSDELNKAIQQLFEDLHRAFANLDIDRINAIVAPHGRKVFNSHEEFMAMATARALERMETHFSRMKAFEEEE